MGDFIMRNGWLGSFKHKHKTTRIANARFTDEIEFYLPKNKAVPFLARVQEQI